MKNKNEMKLIFPSNPENERLARIAVSAFISELGPTIAEIAEIKTAVSEAVTNCIVHAYREKPGMITLTVKATSSKVHIRITDRGCGIDDVKRAMEPLYTSRPEEERAGLGFAVMESFTDRMTVKSAPKKGTTVTLIKNICC
ncbi:MAG: anti-sigma F factor [Ruminococcus sp.]|jgi:stage II sporulation protein AB (anti-sigma F factor)|nr:anti-sigma F factor [Ruminococcus sp.]